MMTSSFLSRNETLSMKSRSFHLLAERLLLPTSFLSSLRMSYNLWSTTKALWIRREARKRIYSFWVERNFKLMKYRAISRFICGFSL